MGAARVGKTLGNFRILECLGSGGSGMIWKAEDLSLGRVVALKALRSELATDGEMSQRFRDEARTLAKLSHANVASLYSLIEDDDGLFLVLEYVEGNTLAALLATSGPLPLDTAFALFHQVLDGVGHAHAAGVVHRDLKPANLMVDARGRVKVMDFGIARVAGAARTTHHGKLVGTPEYMSPEQVRGEDATIRSDLYSLGILLFEMLTGRPPFRAAASFELMRAQVEDAPPDPRALRPELDARIAAAILRALAKRPTDRFATTRELQDVLLGAGASRRGRTIAPASREDASSASAAPTLAHFDRAASAAPAAGSASEPVDAWKHAVDALDGDIDAAFASGDRVQPEGGRRAQAHTTVVLDAAQDTARIDIAPPTRMLEDAPFSAHAHSLRAPPKAGLTLKPGARLAWIVLAATLVALAYGAVRLRSNDPSTPSNAAQQPTARASDEPATSSRPPETAPQSPSRAQAKPERSAPPAPPVKQSRAAQAKAAAKPKPAGAPPHGASQEPGWVIRR